MAGIALMAGAAFTQSSTLTIASGVIIVTQALHIVAAQTGTEDDLDNITQSFDYSDATRAAVVIIQADAGDTIHVKHAAGKIELPGDIDVTLLGGESMILVQDIANSIWVGLAARPAASPNAMLELNQTSLTGAKPVMLLQQTDISEEFTRYIGSSATGVLTQSEILEADVTTATRAGFIKIYVQDDGNQLTDQAYFLPIYTLA